MLMERYTMRDISIVTMSQLVMSKDFAITSEMDLYNMLKTWILELEESSIAEAFNMVDSIFSQLNIPNLTQYSNIRSLKKDNLIPIELIHDATDTNCEMMIRLMADIER